MLQDEADRRAVRAVLAEALAAAPIAEAERRRAEDELTRLLAEARRNSLRGAVRAAWAVGGRYNWEVIRGSQWRTDRLFLARGAWEATRAVEALLPPEPPPPALPPPLAATPIALPAPPRPRSALRFLLGHLWRWLRSVFRGATG